VEHFFATLDSARAIDSSPDLVLLDVENTILSLGMGGLDILYYDKRATRIVGVDWKRNLYRSTSYDVPYYGLSVQLTTKKYRFSSVFIRPELPKYQPEGHWDILARQTRGLSRIEKSKVFAALDDEMKRRVRAARASIREKRLELPDPSATTFQVTSHIMKDFLRDGRYSLNDLNYILEASRDMGMGQLVDSIRRKQLLKKPVMGELLSPPTSYSIRALSARLKLKGHDMDGSYQFLADCFDITALVSIALAKISDTKVYGAFKDHMGEYALEPVPTSLHPLMRAPQNALPQSIGKYTLLLARVSNAKKELSAKHIRLYLTKEVLETSSIKGMERWLCSRARERSRVDQGSLEPASIYDMLEMTTGSLDNQYKPSDYSSQEDWIDKMRLISETSVISTESKKLVTTSLSVLSKSEEFGSVLSQTEICGNILASSMVFANSTNIWHVGKSSSHSILTLTPINKPRSSFGQTTSLTFMALEAGQGRMSVGEVQSRNGIMVAALRPMTYTKKSIQDYIRMPEDVYSSLATLRDLTGKLVASDIEFARAFEQFIKFRRCIRQQFSLVSAQVRYLHQLVNSPSEAMEGLLSKMSGASLKFREEAYFVGRHIFQCLCLLILKRNPSAMLREPALFNVSTKQVFYRFPEFPVPQAEPNISINLYYTELFQQ